MELYRREGKQSALVNWHRLSLQRSPALYTESMPERTIERNAVPLFLLLLLVDTLTFGSFKCDLWLTRARCKIMIDGSTRRSLSINRIYKFLVPFARKIFKRQAEFLLVFFFHLHRRQLALAWFSEKFIIPWGNTVKHQNKINHED